MTNKKAETIFLSEFSLVNALGNNNKDIQKNMFEGVRTGLVEREGLLNEGRLFVGEVNAELPSLSTKKPYFNTRNNQLAKLALFALENEINDVKSLTPTHRIGVIVGTSTSGIAEGEQAIVEKNTSGEFSKNYDYRMQEMFNLAEFISEELSIDGPAYTISTACSSSAKAFITAKELIHAGIIDAAIVGGVDSLCGMTVNGFTALDSTSTGLCQPSSANRNGINLGEAAALCVLRKDKGHIRLLGCGESSDAHHMSAPHPEGEGAISAMQQTLAEANLNASDVDYINLHGTATKKNDSMEAIAVDKVFGTQTPCSSVKGMIGHTLGAAGATEIGLCWLILQAENTLYIPHCWDESKDEELPNIALTTVGQNKGSGFTTCLSNSFAFGGNNVSVLIGK
ncbi:beta-ketoacyl-[acyl-carrier-protein] synthase family protein [Colwellia sp. UCD-KL20]|uniref:beta-ketoacyl-[acyl-carrier-protein] synthase family protein n=1 Tax=Colwellia sp. UCD-KL20 TaxID=1917165 RepID=UPI0009702D6C|nr:beta-ketoacyl-[acyl-carrier-protein] synthase family protein [Colwellia sp. UCD-KL20]